MNEWWDQLSSREKNYLFYAGIVIVFSLFYFLLWQPTSSALEVRMTRLSSSKNTLTSMEKFASKSGSSRHSTRSSRQSLSSIVPALQTLLRKNNLLNLAVIESDSLSRANVRFAPVSFDRLIKVLVIFTRNYRVKIIKFTATRKSLGIVQASFLIES
jgi:type II secretory pathway component PulM